MPRRVDVERQQATIAEAVWRLVARGGLESVSLREVAAEAGVSMGRVQHYFPTKDAMLLHGLRLAMARMETRIGERIGARDLDDAGAEDVLRAALEEMLGEHADTRQVIRVCVAYFGRAADDPAVADVLFGDDEQLYVLAAQVVCAAQAAGRASAVLDPELEARVMWSLAENLGIKVAFGQTTFAEARRTLRYHLDRTLGTHEG